MRTEWQKWSDLSARHEAHQPRAGRLSKPLVRTDGVLEGLLGVGTLWVAAPRSGPLSLLICHVTVEQALNEEEQWSIDPDQ